MNVLYACTKFAAPLVKHQLVIYEFLTQKIKAI